MGGLARAVFDQRGIAGAMNSKSQKITAVILAGETHQEIFPDPSITNRAMIPLAGKTVLQWVVDALRGSEMAGRIIAVGNVKADGLDTVVSPPGGNFLNSLMTGLDAVEGECRVLILLSDIPLLTAEAVADFLIRAEEMEAEVVFPIVAKHICNRRYPEIKRTYVRVREGEFTMGNLALVDTEFVKRNSSLIEGVFAARKSPFRMAGLVGFGLILRLLLARLGISSALPLRKIEEAASRVLGGRLAVIQSEFPEIAEDMDRPGDLEIMERIFRTIIRSAD